MTIHYKGQPLKKIKSLTLQNVYTKAEFDLATGKMTYAPKGNLTVKAEAQLDTFFVALFPDTHFAPVLTVETEDGEIYHHEIKEPFNCQRAKYYLEMLSYLVLHALTLTELSGEDTTCSMSLARI